MSSAILRASGPPIRAVAGLVASFAAPHKSGHILHLLLSFGLAGLFLVSIVDSSFVPLPVPGITDIMVVVMAAQHANVFLLVGLATAGSILGGLFSWQVGHAGGVAFLERHVSKRIFDRVCSWMQNHAILSVALPAVLPPPMPLSPFVLAAGALNMPRRKFMVTFTASRFLRHLAAAAIGIHYGPHVLHIWNLFTRKYGALILSVIWASILISVAFAIWKLYKTSRSMGNGGSAGDGGTHDSHEQEPRTARA
jgi:membrane protein YqaA with SNARE-associated domain